MLYTLVSAATTTGAKTAHAGIPEGTKTFQAHGVTSAGAGAATIAVQGTVDGTVWDTIGTISLTLSTTASGEGFTSADAYSAFRANVTEISGTGAAVTLVVNG